MSSWIAGSSPAITAVRRKLSRPQEYQFDVVVFAPFQFLVTFRRFEPGIRRFLHHDQRAPRQPAALARGGKRLFGEALAVGRIEERQRERLERMRGTELAGIAPENAGDAAQPELLGVVAQQRARLHAVVDEQRVSRAARCCATTPSSSGWAASPAFSGAMPASSVPRIRSSRLRWPSSIRPTARASPKRRLPPRARAAG